MESSGVEGPLPFSLDLNKNPLRLPRNSCPGLPQTSTGVPLLAVPVQGQGRELLHLELPRRLLGVERKF